MKTAVEDDYVATMAESLNPGLLRYALGHRCRHSVFFAGGALVAAPARLATTADLRSAWSDTLDSRAASTSRFSRPERSVGYELIRPSWLADGTGRHAELVVRHHLVRTLAAFIGAVSTHCRFAIHGAARRWTSLTPVARIGAVYRGRSHHAVHLLGAVGAHLGLPGVGARATERQPIVRRNALSDYPGRAPAFYCSPGRLLPFWRHRISLEFDKIGLGLDGLSVDPDLRGVWHQVRLSAVLHNWLHRLPIRRQRRKRDRVP